MSNQFDYVLKVPPEITEIKLFKKPNLHNALRIDEFSLTVNVEGNGIDEQSSNHRCDFLRFTSLKCAWRKGMKPSVFPPPSSEKIVRQSGRFFLG